MTEILQELNLNQIATLLSRYGFESRGLAPQELIERWQPLYPLKWIRLAVVEALYQGRYKVISVEQILNLWLRRGQPTFHFNLEFERLICHSLLRHPEETPELVFCPPVEPEISQAISLPLEIASAPPSVNPRQVLSNLDDLFSQFSPLSSEENQPRATNFKVGESITQPESEDLAQEAPLENASKASIDQFIPLLDSSGLYPKLKAVVQKV